MTRQQSHQIIPTGKCTESESEPFLHADPHKDVCVEVRLVQTETCGRNLDFGDVCGIGARQPFDKVYRDREFDTVLNADDQALGQRVVIRRRGVSGSTLSSSAASAHAMSSSVIGGAGLVSLMPRLLRPSRDRA